MAMIQHCGFYWSAVLLIMPYLALCGHSLNVSNYKWRHLYKDGNHLCLNMTEGDIIECSRSSLVTVSIDWNGSVETFYLCGNAASHNCSGLRGILNYNNTNQTIRGEDHVLKPNESCRFLGTNFTNLCYLSEDGILDCSKRNVKSLAITGSDFILGLNLSYNLLESTPLLRNCSNIEWIDMSNNQHLSKALNKASFERIVSESLKVVNISNCRIIRVQPFPLDHFFPSLQILLLSKNNLRSFDVSSLSNLTAFRLLDLRDNKISRQYIFPCNLTSQNAIILVNEFDCSFSCVQDFIKQNQDLDVLLPTCQDDEMTDDKDLDGDKMTSITPSDISDLEGTDDNVNTDGIMLKTAIIGSFSVILLLIGIIFYLTRALKEERHFSIWFGKTPSYGISVESIS